MLTFQHQKGTEAISFRRMLAWCQQTVFMSLSWKWDMWSASQHVIISALSQNLRKTWLLNTFKHLEFSRVDFRNQAGILCEEPLFYTMTFFCSCSSQRPQVQFLGWVLLVSQRWREGWIPLHSSTTPTPHPPTPHAFWASLHRHTIKIGLWPWSG